MIIVGIDPGISGAIAWLDQHGSLLKIEDMPVMEIKVGKGLRRKLVPALLANMFDPPHQPTKVYLEEVSSRPGEGAVGAFSFGRGFGQIEGILAAMEIPMELVHPAKWKKALSVPADKGSARARACRNWPHLAHLFARVKDDGRAEAALIGLYGTGAAS